MYQDKTIVCKDCGQTFVFTAGEQEFYAERGFQNEPQRCKSCRDQEKEWQPSGTRVFHCDLRCLRRGSARAVPAEGRQTGILQRMLRKDAGKGLIQSNLQNTRG